MLTKHVRRRYKTELNNVVLIAGKQPISKKITNTLITYFTSRLFKDNQLQQKTYGYHFQKSKILVIESHNSEHIINRFQAEVHIEEFNVILYLLILREFTCMIWTFQPFKSKFVLCFCFCIMAETNHGAASQINTWTCYKRSNYRHI